MKKTNHYACRSGMLWGLLLAGSQLFLTACSEDTIETYSGSAKINLFVQTRLTQASEAQMPLGFLDDAVADSTIQLVANIQGVKVKRDRIIHLDVPDSLKSRRNVLYSFPDEAILPADSVSVRIPVTVQKNGLDAFPDGFRLIIRVADSEDFSAGVYTFVSLLATNQMPVQWVGATNWVNTYMGECSKTKYRFLYNTMGFYDFTPYAKDYNQLSVFKKYLNLKLDEYEVQHGTRLWDPDLNKNVSFP